MNAFWWKNINWFKWGVDEFYKRVNVYKFLITPLIEPFFNQFWINDIWTNSLNKTYDEFQELILFCEDYGDLKVYLEKKGYKLLGVKVCIYEINKKWHKNVFSTYEEHWTELDTKVLIERALEKQNISFWFLPWDQDNTFLLLFAEEKPDILNWVKWDVNNLIL